MKRAALTLFAVVALTVCELREGKTAAEAASSTFGYDTYAAVLKTYVNNHGLVNYKRLKANDTQLNAFTAILETLDPKIYDQWSDKNKIAFWLNAYNAFTLKAIITYYPIQPSLLASLRFPKNSIRQIPGVWDELRFGVMGRKLTLDEIEHEILRKQFKEPRIHMALVCAAMGCPQLRHEPYMGDTLDAQLADQTRRLLQNSLKFRIDQGEGRVYLSSIFKWFGEDFVKMYSANGKFNRQSEIEGAVLNFVSQHLEEADRRYLATETYSIEYLDYDWSLNEQSPI